MQEEDELPSEVEGFELRKSGGRGTGYTNVYRKGEHSFIAQVHKNGKSHNLGTHSTKVEAALAVAKFKANRQAEAGSTSVPESSSVQHSSAERSSMPAPASRVHVQDVANGADDDDDTTLPEVIPSWLTPGARIEARWGQ